MPSEQSWAPNANFAPRRLAGPVAPVAVALQVGRPALSDSGYAEALDSYGVIIPGQSDTSGTFYSVTITDSSFTSESLGLLRARSLLEPGTDIQLLADDGGMATASIVNRQAVDSAFRHADEGCVLGVPVALSRPEGRLPWVIAVGLRSARPNRRGLMMSRDAADIREATRLAALVPADTNALGDGIPSPAQIFADVRQRVFVQRSSLDGADLLVVRAERRKPFEVPGEGGGESTKLNLIEQRLLIAEHQGTRPYTLAWSRYAAYDEDESSSETPAAIMLMGAARVPTLLTRGQYRDGVGGLFVARVAPGRWTEAAYWYGGC